jgi:hypothetical protein
MCSFANADVKDLVCTVNVSDEILNLSWVKPKKVMEITDDYEFVETDEYEEGHMEVYNHCKNSEIAWQYSIRLDTNDIGKVDANVENSIIENCTSASNGEPFPMEVYGTAFLDNGKTKSFLMRTTPSYLLFSEYDHFNNPFQVDRKTLEGFDNQKEVAFECILNDVEEQENVL